MFRGGTGAWTRVFDESRSFEAANEYLPALPTVDLGPAYFLDRFAELVPSFPVHVAGHPPGLPLVMHALALDTPARLAAFCIVVGALGAPLTYGLARGLFDERGARFAGLLMALSPQALMFGVTTADAVYLTLGLLAAWPLTRSSVRARVLGAVLLAIATLFAWSLLAIGAWAAILAWRRGGLRSAIVLSATCGAVLLAFHGAFSALTGFDPIGTVRATEEVYRLGIASTRPYWYWLFGSPVGFLLVLGLPITWLALRELARGTPEAVAIFAVLAIAAVMGFTKAETERIWLFFAPFVCLAAARALTAAPACSCRSRRRSPCRRCSTRGCRTPCGERTSGGPRRPPSREPPGAAGRGCYQAEPPSPVRVGRGCSRTTGVAWKCVSERREPDREPVGAKERITCSSAGCDGRPAARRRRRSRE